ncbi:hypothetical protein MMC13_003205 [Lambiella insularis]|nr:hypothetical protein [Lambiella insularis]
MAQSSARPENNVQQYHKLKRLPKNARIEKRPILHPAIPSPYTNASQPKIIYVSSKTPFISVVKRVRKHLALIDKRTMGKVDLLNSKSSDKHRLSRLGKQDKEPEEVFLRATNKAIEKVLGLALFFQGQEDCRVKLKTGSVGVIDDIVEVAKPESGEPGDTHQGLDDAQNEDMTNGSKDKVPDAREQDDDEEMPETQIRQVGVVEVCISLI